MSSDLVQSWRKDYGDKTKIVNLYGPTETTMAKCYYEIPDKTGLMPVLPIGKPLPETQILILNNQLKQCGIGELGEIYIRTPFITLGYLDNEKNNQFMVNPFTGNPDDIIYKTGDLGLYSNDGILEIKGRVDDQIKIRGIRVELGEIKSIISNHPHIQEAVITAVSTDNYEKKIIAYIVPKSNQLDIKELRTYTQQKMPLYMVPEIFMKIKSIPLNSNGKVDRNRLPEPTSDEVRISDVNVPPTNITERKIKEVWVDILKQDNISINDNFFDVGGHSLLILQVKTKLELVFEKKIELMDLFQYPTIATLSARINNAGLDNTPFESLRAKGKDRRRALQDRRKRRENLNKQR